MVSLSEFLIREGYVRADDVAAMGVDGRRDSKEGLVQALSTAGILEQEQLAGALSRFHGVELVKRSDWPSAPALSISVAFLREYRVFPIAEDGDGIRLAMSDPSNTYVIDALRLSTGRPVLPVVAPMADIEAAIERWERAQEADSAEASAAVKDVQGDIEHLRDLALETPVVRLVNEMLESAVHARATDIHIEPFDGNTVVRVRVDGMLRSARPPPVELGRAVVSRIKILAGLDIAEHRLPQDGRAQLVVGGRQLDLRVASIPTLHGEAVTIRILQNVRRALDFARLGFSERDRAMLGIQLASPHGMIVVTGPTGSGKTTTLATALSMLNEQHRKILTIEDPIEYEIEGINQTQARPAIGLTFARALRSFLRHDPDVIMVGEMRDEETAGIGVHAALTGHLVLTTLHTNTAASSIARLLDMGVDAFLLASSLRCVVGQRLVRQLCIQCRAPDEDPGLAAAEISLLKRLAGSDPVRLWRAGGCERCHGTGYNDRLVIAEVLTLGTELRALMRSDPSGDEIEQLALRKGMTTMWEDGLAKCLGGRTTIEEVRRVVIAS